MAECVRMQKQGRDELATRVRARGPEAECPRLGRLDFLGYELKISSTWRDGLV